MSYPLAACRGGHVYRSSGPPAPVADFTVFPLSLNFDDLSTFDFTDASTGTVTSYLYEASIAGNDAWNTVSTSQNPSIAADALSALLGGHRGFVDTRLTATGPGGSNTKTRMSYLELTSGGG